MLRPNKSSAMIRGEAPLGHSARADEPKLAVAENKTNTAAVTRTSAALFIAILDPEAERRAARGRAPA
jgi:hypothetical protein